MPLRLEIGPRDVKSEQVMLVRRDTRDKLPVPMDGLGSYVDDLLRTIQNALFEKAVAFRDEHTLRATDRAEFNEYLEGRPGYVVSPW